MTIHLNQCVVVLLSNEQVSMLCEAIRDRRAATTTAEPAPLSVRPALAKCATVHQLPARKVG